MKKVNLILGLAVASLIMLNSCEKDDENPQNVNLQSGLVAYYPFNGNPDDESGNGNHGVAYGASMVADRFGNSDQCYSFDGIDDRITVQASSSLNALGTQMTSWSYSLFIKMQSFPTQGNEFAILSNYYSTSGNDNQFSLCLEEISSGGLRSYIRSSGIDYSANSSNNLNDGNYHHIAWIVNNSSSQIILYIDGALASKVNYDSSKTYNPNNILNIGVHFWDNKWSGHFKGCIDDVRIFNRALNSEEVTALFHTN